MEEPAAAPAPPRWSSSSPPAPLDVSPSDFAAPAASGARHRERSVTEVCRNRDGHTAVGSVLAANTSQACSHPTWPRRPCPVPGTVTEASRTCDGSVTTTRVRRAARAAAGRATGRRGERARRGRRGARRAPGRPPSCSRAAGSPRSARPSASGVDTGAPGLAAPSTPTRSSSRARSAGGRRARRTASSSAIPSSRRRDGPPPAAARGARRTRTSRRSPTGARSGRGRGSRPTPLVFTHDSSSSSSSACRTRCATRTQSANASGSSGGSRSKTT